MAKEVISIKYLRDITNHIFDFIENDLQLSEAVLNQNFYWAISEDDVYELSSEPKEMSVGSLIDDWDVIEGIDGDLSQALPLVFLHIGPLLQYLAAELPNYVSDDSSNNEETAER